MFQVGSEHSSSAGRGGKIGTVWLELALNEKGQKPREMHTCVGGKGMKYWFPSVLTEEQWRRQEYENETPDEEPALVDLS